MITRDDVLSRACDDCIKELYSFVQPSVKWEDFVKECKIYSKCYKEWELYNNAYYNRENNPEEWEKFRKLYAKLDWENKSITECIGPRPYEFYYLPREVMKDICDSYIHAYNIDSQQELLNTILILKNYCREPIVDKYIEGELRKDGTRWPGHMGYEHPDNLKKELRKIFDDEILPDICKQYNKQYNLQTTGIESSVSIAYSQRFQNKFFEFLDMAGNFYDWNRDLNSFNMTVYLGPSPNSNKEAVIENWKKYRGKDIEIDESKYKEEEYE